MERLPWGVARRQPRAYIRDLGCLVVQPSAVPLDQALCEHRVRDLAKPAMLAPMT